MSTPRLKRIFTFWTFVIASAYLVYVYPIVRLTQWYGWDQAIEWYTALLLWAVVVAGLWFSFSGRFGRFKLVLVNWLGVGFIFFSMCAVYELVRLLFQTDDQQAASWIAGAGLIVSVGSFVAAQRLAHKYLEIKSPKLGRNYRIVQISDVHIGSRGGDFLHQIVDRINRLQPDYVMITGDLVDTSKVGSDELIALRDITASVYVTIGNHERYVGLNRVIPMLEDLGLTVLRNNSVVEDDLQLIGIDDDEDPEQVAKTLPSIPMYASKFRVLLYHRPHGWSSAVDEDIELMLSGHTHNGQIFPFNWLVKRQFKLIRGLYRVGGSHLYVSPGTGTWGPVIRLGSRNEITCIDLIADNA